MLLFTDSRARQQVEMTDSWDPVTVLFLCISLANAAVTKQLEEIVKISSCNWILAYRKTKPVLYLIL